MIWRLLLTPPMDGAGNMGLDVALMQRARRTGETVARIYTFSGRTLSFGRNQRVRGEFDPGRLADAALQVVRRPTGGRSLLHDRELTYSVTAPAGGSTRESYAGINRLLINALGRLGVPAAAMGAEGAASLTPSATPCFAAPAAGELIAGGRKLVGSAQWRDDGTLLQHGSILVDDDQAVIGQVMRHPPPAVPPAATLRALLGRAPSAGELAEVLLAAVHDCADPLAERFDAEPQVLEEADRLAEGFRDERWTWRR